MTSIADSDAFFDSHRMLVQHQAALTLLQGRLADPKITQIRWLDLASGKGQIIAHLQKNLSVEERGKVSFLGYDIDNAHSRSARKLADSMELASANFEIGELSKFFENPETKGPWDFITLTNTIHEIQPKALASILIHSIDRLAEGGCFFIYDMETLSDPELGAVLWTGSEMKGILAKLLKELGSTNYRPPVGTWTHRSCDGWNAQLQRNHIDLPGNYRDLMGAAIDNTAVYIKSLLKTKLDQVQGVLEGLTQYGPETDAEAHEKERYLFDFWAIYRALDFKS
jgi:hypothetical protein